MPKTTAPVVAAGSMAARIQPVLRVDELVLRPWQGQDVPALVRAYGDPAIQRWHCRTMTAAEATAWVLAANGEWLSETRANWAVTAHDVLLGRVALGTTNMSEGIAAVGYWVLPEARGRGVAPRAVTSVAGWATAELGVHRLELEHSTRNPQSCRVAEKAGFALEGTKRSQALHDDGWHDMHMHVHFNGHANGTLSAAE